MSEQARPKLIAEYKAEFYDHQRQQANIFEDMIKEIYGLNQVVQSLTPKEAPAEAPAA